MPGSSGEQSCNAQGEWETCETVSLGAWTLGELRGRRHALISADAAIPYRTTAASAEKYDSVSVAATLDEDLRRNGAPLVYRLDRASCHRTDEVDEVQRAHGVLRLHGPPHHPDFYGQLERQNQEYRAWLDAGDPLGADMLDGELLNMRRALNALRPRPTLSNRTAEEVWKQRPVLRENRSKLRDEVAERAARIASELEERRVPGGIEDFAQRIAIEQALTQRGHLRCELGGWC